MTHGREAKRLIAVAGTPITLASILLEFPDYDPVASHGATLSQASLRDLLARIQTMTVPEIARIPQVEHGREDVLLAGALILDEVMEQLGKGEVLVSGRGCATDRGRRGDTTGRVIIRLPRVLSISTELASAPARNPQPLASQSRHR